MPAPRETRPGFWGLEDHDPALEDPRITPMPFGRTINTSDPHTDTKKSKKTFQLGMSERMG